MPSALSALRPDSLAALILAGACGLLACGDPSAAPPEDGSAPNSGRDAGVTGVTEPVEARDAQATEAGEASRPDAAVDASEPAADAGNIPRVEVTTGTLRGRLDGRTRVFEGIPYAQPPVGKLRFAMPRAAGAWDGERDATQPGPVCFHVTEEAPVDSRTGSTMTESEDCLSLAVYAPAPSPAQGAPVMVFVHGGSGNTGAGSTYDGRALSEAGDVVVVTLNYRLGTLAWLVHPELDDELGSPSGNLALRDQQLALRWVRDNIAAFGGDPGNVTLFGQSFGASATCFHMFARGSEGLARRFILQSGGCVGSAVAPGTREGTQARSQQVVDELCAGESDVLACLRAADAKQLAILGAHGLPIEEAQGIYVDGELVPELPRDMLARGDYAHAPVLLGNTRHESAFLASPHFGDKWPLVADTPSLLIGLGAMYPDDWPAILGHYGLPADADANGTMVRVMGDSWLRCNARAFGLAASSQGDPIYLYSFDLPPAVHIQDLDYVFGAGASPWSALFEGAPVPLVESLVAAMQGYWTRFARSGDPNEASPALGWPRFEEGEESYLSLDRQLEVGRQHLRDDCEFWAGTRAGGH